MRIIKAGATSQIIYVEILDSTSTTGGRKTGLAYNTSSLTAYYTLSGAAAVAITLATQTVTGAWSSGGFVEVSSANAPGLYRLDLPDAAVASGVSVVVTLKGATGMVQVSEEIQLVAINLQDAVRAGLTALPNANAEAAGGLYTRGSGAGQINQDANGRVDVSLKAILGTALTETSGQIAAGFKKLFDVAAPVFTLLSVNQTGDAYARLGAPAGASHAADTAAVKVDTAAVKVQTDKLAFTVANQIDSNVIDWKGATAPAMTGDAYARLGAPAGASVSADVAATKALLPTALVSGRMDASVGAMAANVLTATAIATDAITAAKIAADAIGASELAADAVAEIQSGLSTYAGGDTSGTTTLLTRLSATRAGYLDNLSAGGVATAASIAALNNLSAAAVNAEVVDALATDTYAEPGQGTPGATISLAAKIGYLYKAFRNKKTQTASAFNLFADDTTTVDQKSSFADDGTTATVGEVATGP